MDQNIFSIQQEFNAFGLLVWTVERTCPDKRKKWWKSGFEKKKFLKVHFWSNKAYVYTFNENLGQQTNSNSNLCVCFLLENFDPLQSSVLQITVKVMYKLFIFTQKGTDLKKNG